MSSNHWKAELRLSSETLKILFDIKQDAIDRDIQRAEIDIHSIKIEIKSLFALPLSAKTPRTNARRMHLLMVLAHELCRREAVAPELNTFNAAFGTDHIAEDAAMVATDKDTCAELWSRMKAIEQREGLTDEQFWPRGEGPQDYQALRNEFEHKLEGIVDTVFIFVMRRYHMDEQADLFERDRVEFDIQREIGRRVLYEKVEDAENNDYFRRKYGTKALQRVLSRSRQLRRERA